MEGKIVGAILAVLCAAIIIFAIETGKSLLQLIAGFVLFILPITILSSFRSTAGSFIVGFYVIIIGYIIYKFSYYDSLLGILLAVIIGGTMFYFRVNPYQPFSSEKYKAESKNERGGTE
jgi:predicted membrane protein